MASKLGFIVAAILLLCPPVTEAATYYWQVSSGDWSTPENWGGVEPTSNDYAYIKNNGVATITQTGESCKNLYLGDTNSGTVEMSDGSLSISSNSYIGYSEIGTFTQIGGINSINSTVYVGYSSGSNGTY
jgi:hypothetical protein